MNVEQPKDALVKLEIALKDANKQRITAVQRVRPELKEADLRRYLEDDYDPRLFSFPKLTARFASRAREMMAPEVLPDFEQIGLREDAMSDGLESIILEDTLAELRAQSLAAQPGFREELTRILGFYIAETCDEYGLIPPPTILLLAGKKPSDIRTDHLQTQGEKYMASEELRRFIEEFPHVQNFVDLILPPIKAD